ncbi:helix-turn-helix transcriptional regulator [Ktedonospora formicarum]|uniref:DNA-binding transcriptional regulator n=1 Tax=Ktedonospora formicarum TaxID=2778364 RepID=A0A8J3I5W1_9CHLR|nr:YafY family protein [Ktedonospora formicarum]GHO47648.1 DNA-binding transcriptional regulator [Ktedonospora formicarum]
MDRLTAIVLLLQGGRRTAGEIARRFEVSKRTVFRDIEALCEMGIPIVTEAGANGGYTLMPDYSLTPLQLTFHETMLLRLALSSISQLAQTPFKQERESLLAKVQALIPPQHRPETDQLLQTVQFNVPTRSYATPFIEQFIESARTQQWLRVMYRSQQRTSQQTILPRRLSSSGGFWYCEAYSQEHQEERTYRVDRFIAVSATQPPEHPTPLPSRLPYKHPSHPEVRIRLTARGALLMERNPYFSDAIQPLGEEEGLLCFRWPPAENDWLARLLLSFGPDAEVLAPPPLRNLVREMAQEVVDRHHQ